VTLPDGIRLRPATEADLPGCEAIWREGLNDYLLPIGQPEIPPDNVGVRQLHAHTLATDPALFRVATRVDEATGEEQVVAFTSAVRREAVWFLSMLFVRPGLQAAGLGRALLDAVVPADGRRAGGPVTMAVATDAAQPVSNGLYAAYGMVSRMPGFNLVGRPGRPAALAALPSGIVRSRFDPPGPGEDGRDLEAAIDALDRSALGFAHPVDHAFVRREGRSLLAYRDESGDLAGYGYTSAVGRIGPVAVRSADLLAPIVADLLTAIEPRGASAIWVPGAAATTVEMLVRAGLRIEGFPVLFGWSRPFADFERYIPRSPGLL
jgi:GNAT superfamily N-acetyltransferase